MSTRDLRLRLNSYLISTDTDAVSYDSDILEDCVISADKGYESWHDLEDWDNPTLINDYYNVAGIFTYLGVEHEVSAYFGYADDECRSLALVDSSGNELLEEDVMEQVSAAINVAFAQSREDIDNKTRNRRQATKLRNNLGW